MGFPTVGGYTICGYSGSPQLGEIKLNRFRRPGVSGQDYQSTGGEGKAFTLTLHVDTTTAALRETAYLAFLNLKGSTIYVVDTSGITHGPFMVLDLGQPRRWQGLAASGGVNGGTFRLDLPITMEAV